MRLWILSASTGGGHDMRAFALKKWWEKRGGVAEVFHPLEESFWGYRIGCNLYNTIQKYLPILHFIYFFFLEFVSMHRNANFILGKKRFVKEMTRFSPDIIVSTHAHLNHGFFDITQAGYMKKKPKFVIYCGELDKGVGFSRHWVNVNIDLFVSPYSEVCIAARELGMPEKKCLVSGPLLRAKFYENIPLRSEILKNFGLNALLPIYLLGTGANGVNKHISIVRAFKREKIKCQIIALCGKSSELLEELEQEDADENVKIIAMSQIEADLMVQFLKISTWIFARPGAGLTTEAIVTGCPVIFDTSRGIMPQEYNNLNFWQKRAKSLVCCSSTKQVVEVVLTKKEIPRLHLPVEESPSILLNKLEAMAT